jgi:hypothetical protein
LSASVNDAETGQSLLMMKSTSAGASEPAAAMRGLSGLLRSPNPLQMCDDQDKWTGIYRTLQRAARGPKPIHRTVRVPASPKVPSASSPNSSDPRVETQNQDELVSGLPVLTRRWIESGE